MFIPFRDGGGAECIVILSIVLIVLNGMRGGYPELTLFKMNIVRVYRSIINLLLKISFGVLRIKKYEPLGMSCISASKEKCPGIALSV